MITLTLTADEALLIRTVLRNECREASAAATRTEDPARLHFLQDRAGACTALSVKVARAADAAAE